MNADQRGGERGRYRRPLLDQLGKFGDPHPDLLALRSAKLGVELPRGARARHDGHDPKSRWSRLGCEWNVRLRRRRS